MDAQELMAASKIVGDLAERFGDLPEEKKKGVEAGLLLTLAQSYLVELATHLSSGLDPYDAMIAMSKGVLPISDSKSTLFHLMAAKPSQE